jgi:hypothetical protein
LTETGVSLNEGEGLDVDDITLTAAEEGDAAANGEEVEEVVVPPQVCWCGLISDEVNFLRTNPCTTLLYPQPNRTHPDPLPG